MPPHELFAKMSSNSKETKKKIQIQRVADWCNMLQNFGNEKYL